MPFLPGFRYVNCIGLRGGLGGFLLRSFGFVSIVPEVGLIIGKVRGTNLIGERQFQNNRPVTPPRPDISSTWWIPVQTRIWAGRPAALRGVQASPEIVPRGTNFGEWDGGGEVCWKWLVFC